MIRTITSFRTWQSAWDWWIRIRIVQMIAVVIVVVADFRMELFVGLEVLRQQQFRIFGYEIFG